MGQGEGGRGREEGWKGVKVPARRLGSFSSGERDLSQGDAKVGEFLIRTEQREERGWRYSK